MKQFIFPTYVGVNRYAKTNTGTDDRIFPTYVGVNRGQSLFNGGAKIFPTYVGVNRRYWLSYRIAF